MADTKLSTAKFTNLTKICALQYSSIVPASLYSLVFYQSRREIGTLQSKLNLPQTVIAVVGGTGSGKSSVVNALLDHANVLPTSGLRACTAAVVEVSTLSNGSQYEAEIEFLSQEEWEAELKILLTQLSSKDGRVRSRQPSDQKPEEEIAWHKVRAVYGDFKDGVTLEKLRKKCGVTRLLGRVKKITDSSVGGQEGCFNVCCIH